MNNCAQGHGVTVCMIYNIVGPIQLSYLMATPHISSLAIACSDVISFPSICIPHVKTCIEESGGASGSVIPMTREFIKAAFSIYGEISEVVMTTRYATDRDGNSHTRAEEYYRVHIHFKRWNIENGEARYVRSVLMSSSTAANIKLSYSGPWYWKFSALRP